MNEPDKNFDALSKLLAWKRHEIPPPGYFDHFSDQVVNRIRSEVRANPAKVFERLLAEAPWLQNLFNAFQARPALSGVFASAMGLLIVAGIVYSDNPNASQAAMNSGQDVQGGSPLASMSPAFLDQTVAQSDLGSSTNPATSLEPSPSPFGNPNPLFQTVGFSH